MKKKFYASLCLGMSLTVTALPSFAKAPQPASKKQVSISTKPAKPSVSGKKTEPKKPLSTAEKQKPSQSGKNHSVADVKDNKHDKSEKHQLADAKDSKHGKNKSKQLLEAKDNKHGKTKLHEVADAKDSKHNRTKAQQLADARDKKHGRKKSHHAVDESYTDENEDASTAVIDEQDQTAENNDNVVEQSNSGYTPSQQPSVSAYDEKNQALIAMPPKSSNLFFQPLNKNVEVQPFGDNQTKPDSRVHTSISNGTTTSNVDAQPLSSHNGNRVHSSIAGNGNNFIDNSGNHEINAQVVSTHAIVGDSLTSAGESAGLSNDMIIELTDIFAWDIDFANNLQSDDQFTVIYEQTGSGKASNRIIAAQFVNQGKTYTAIRYKDKEGIVSYYTPEGRSMRKAFLSAPIDVVRVSSPFSTHRRHPILNRIRAHKGVDYAARTGTPVKAAGDGVIMFHGTQGGYGNMIVIAHGEHYETAYAHLSNFRKDLEDGEIVKQGDVIGYVGQSGLATGPHLHYEFRVDGVHRDPENLDSKQAMRLANEEWQDFHAQTIPMLTQLNQAKAKTLVAKNP